MSQPNSHPQGSWWYSRKVTWLSHTETRNINTITVLKSQKIDPSFWGVCTSHCHCNWNLPLQHCHNHSQVWYQYLPLHYGTRLAIHLVTHFKVLGSTVPHPSIDDLYTYVQLTMYDMTQKIIPLNQLPKLINICIVILYLYCLTLLCNNFIAVIIFTLYALVCDSLVIFLKYHYDPWG